MPRAARQTDTISHGGLIVAGSEDVITNFLQKARIGDPVLCYQHGPQTIAGGSLDVLVNWRGAARLGDLISCGATIVSGSPDVMIDGMG